MALLHKLSAMCLQSPQLMLKPLCIRAVHRRFDQLGAAVACQTWFVWALGSNRVGFCASTSN